MISGKLCCSRRLGHALLGGMLVIMVLKTGEEERATRLSTQYCHTEHVRPRLILKRNRDISPLSDSCTITRICNFLNSQVTGFGVVYLYTMNQLQVFWLNPSSLFFGSSSHRGTGPYVNQASGSWTLAICKLHL